MSDWIPVSEIVWSFAVFGCIAAGSLLIGTLWLIKDSVVDYVKYKSSMARDKKVRALFSEYDIGDPNKQGELLWTCKFLLKKGQTKRDIILLLEEIKRMRKEGEDDEID